MLTPAESLLLQEVCLQSPELLLKWNSRSKVALFLRFAGDSRLLDPIYVLFLYSYLKQTSFVTLSIILRPDQELQGTPTVHSPSWDFDTRIHVGVRGDVR